MEDPPAVPVEQGNEYWKEKYIELLEQMHVLSENLNLIDKDELSDRLTN
jgi:hypothetical protein